MRRFVLLAALVVVLLSCSQEDFGEPISVPEHPAFILRSVMDENRITVVDLDEEKIVGYRQVVKGQYVVEDFAVSPDNLIFLPVSWFEITVDDGKCVLVADIESEKLLKDSITTSLWPTYIYSFLDRTKALVGHPGIIWGDTDVVSTELDVVNRKVIKTLRFTALLDNVLSFEDGGTYLLYTQGWSPYQQFVQRFDAEGDSIIGEPYELEEIFSGAALVNAVVVSQDEFAAQGGKGIVFFNCNTGVLTDEVTLGDSPDRCLVHNGKLYVCHNTGGLMKHGNHNKVSVIDLESKSVIKTIEVCNAPCDIAYSAATNKIVVVSGVGTVITFIDPETDSVTNTLVSDEVGDVDEWGYLRLRIPE